MTDWDHKDEWSRHGDGFRIVVSRHFSYSPYPDSDGSGPNRWCVYAYMYPQHPQFAKFSGDNMWQEAALALPLHTGPSLLRWHYDSKGGATSVQIGADYNHIDDQIFTRCETSDDAWTVFADAEELYRYLAEEPA